MKKIKYIFLFAVLALAACEEQPVIIPMNMGPDEPDTTETVRRVVLFEELTGVSCAPCFDGAAVVEEIIEDFGDRVVVNGIHGAFQSEPTSESKYDFRNPDAQELETSFYFFGKPAAIIDRFEFQDIGFLAIDARDFWSTKVAERLNVPPAMELSATSEYDESTRVAKIKIEGTALEDIDGAIKIHALINESKLIDAQLSISFGIVTDFEHKHVMRDMLTTTQGDVIELNGLSTGDPVEREFTYTVPAENNGEWVSENMEVLYYFTASDRSGEVLQAGAIHLTE